MFEIGVLVAMVAVVCVVEAMVGRRPGGDLTGERGNALWREMRRRR